jgi:hypothetical protein
VSSLNQQGTSQLDQVTQQKPQQQQQQQQHQHQRQQLLQQQQPSSLQSPDLGTDADDPVKQSIINMHTLLTAGSSKKSEHRVPSTGPRTPHAPPHIQSLNLANDALLRSSAVKSLEAGSFQVHNGLVIVALRCPIARYRRILSDVSLIVVLLTFGHRPAHPTWRRLIVCSLEFVNRGWDFIFARRHQ